MSSIFSKVKPDLNLLVVDGTIGQQAFNQAAAFHKASPVGGIVVTKLDGAAKGGGALAAVGATGAKVFFIGTGERVDDLEEFSATRFVGRLLGMGDLKALLDMAKQFEGEVDEKRVQRMMSGRLTMDDFLFQFEQVNKMGSLKKILDLIPGVSGNMKSEDLEKAEKNMKTWKSIIQAMTARGESGAGEAERPEGEADRPGVRQEREGREGADRQVQADEEPHEVGQGPGDEADAQESGRSSPAWMRSPRSFHYVGFCRDRQGPGEFDLPLAATRRDASSARGCRATWEGLPRRSSPVWGSSSSGRSPSG